MVSKISKLLIFLLLTFICVENALSLCKDSTLCVDEYPTIFPKSVIPAKFVFQENQKLSIKESLDCNLIVLTETILVGVTSCLEQLVIQGSKAGPYAFAYKVEILGYGNVAFKFEKAHRPYFIIYSGNEEKSYNNDLFFIKLDRPLVPHQGSEFKPLLTDNSIKESSDKYKINNDLFNSSASLYDIIPYGIHRRASDNKLIYRHSSIEYFIYNGRKKSQGMFLTNEEFLGYADKEWDNLYQAGNRFFLPFSSFRDTTINYPFSVQVADDHIYANGVMNTYIFGFSYNQQSTDLQHREPIVLRNKFNGSYINNIANNQSQLGNTQENISLTSSESLTTFRSVIRIIKDTYDSSFDDSDKGSLVVNCFHAGWYSCMVIGIISNTVERSLKINGIEFKYVDIYLIPLGNVISRLVKFNTGNVPLQEDQYLVHFKKAKFSRDGGYYFNFYKSGIEISSSNTITTQSLKQYQESIKRLVTETKIIQKVEGPTVTAVSESLDSSSPESGYSPTKTATIPASPNDAQNSGPRITPILSGDGSTKKSISPRTELVVTPKGNSKERSSADLFSGRRFTEPFDQPDENIEQLEATFNRIDRLFQENQRNNILELYDNNEYQTLFEQVAVQVNGMQGAKLQQYGSFIGELEKIRYQQTEDVQEFNKYLLKYLRNSLKLKYLTDFCNENPKLCEGEKDSRFNLFIKAKKTELITSQKEVIALLLKPMMTNLILILTEEYPKDTVKTKFLDFFNIKVESGQYTTPKDLPLTLWLSITPEIYPILGLDEYVKMLNNLYDSPRSSDSLLKWIYNRTKVLVYLHYAVIYNDLIHSANNFLYTHGSDSNDWDQLNIIALLDEKTLGLKNDATYRSIKKNLTSLSGKANNQLTQITGFDNRLIDTFENNNNKGYFTLYQEFITKDFPPQDYVVFFMSIITSLNNYFKIVDKIKSRNILPHQERSVINTYKILSDPMTAGTIHITQPTEEFMRTEKNKIAQIDFFNLKYLSLINVIFRDYNLSSQKRFEILRNQTMVAKVERSSEQHKVKLDEKLKQMLMKGSISSAYSVVTLRGTYDAFQREQKHHLNGIYHTLDDDKFFLVFDDKLKVIKLVSNQKKSFFSATPSTVFLPNSVLEEAFNDVLPSFNVPDTKQLQQDIIEYANMLDVRLGISYKKPQPTETDSKTGKSQRGENYTKLDEAPVITSHESNSFFMANFIRYNIFLGLYVDTNKPQQEGIESLTKFLQTTAIATGNGLEVMPDALKNQITNGIDYQRTIVFNNYLQNVLKSSLILLWYNNNIPLNSKIYLSVRDDPIILKVKYLSERGTEVSKPTNRTEELDNFKAYERLRAGFVVQLQENLMKLNDSVDELIKITQDKTINNNGVFNNLYELVFTYKNSSDAYIDSNNDIFNISTGLQDHLKATFPKNLKSLLTYSNLLLIYRDTLISTKIFLEQKFPDEFKTNNSLLNEHLDSVYAYKLVYNQIDDLIKKINDLFGSDRQWKQEYDTFMKTANPIFGLNQEASAKDMNSFLVSVYNSCYISGTISSTGHITVSQEKTGLNDKVLYRLLSKYLNCYYVNLEKMYNDLFPLENENDTETSTINDGLKALNTMYFYQVYQLVHELDTLFSDGVFTERDLNDTLREHSSAILIPSEHYLKLQKEQPSLTYFVFSYHDLLYYNVVSVDPTLKPKQPTLVVVATNKSGATPTKPVAIPSSKPVAVPTSKQSTRSTTKSESGQGRDNYSTIIFHKGKSGDDSSDSVGERTKLTFGEGSNKPSFGGGSSSSLGDIGSENDSTTGVVKSKRSSQTNFYIADTGMTQLNSLHRYQIEDGVYLQNDEFYQLINGFVRKLIFRTKDDEKNTKAYFQGMHEKSVDNSDYDKYFTNFHRLSNEFYMPAFFYYAYMYPLLSTRKSETSSNNLFKSKPTLKAIGPLFK